jgi:hypothetical protein
MAEGAILPVDGLPTCGGGFVWLRSKSEKDAGGGGSILRPASFGASVCWLDLLGYRCDPKESKASGDGYTKQLAAHEKPFGHSREASKFETATTLLVRRP